MATEDKNNYQNCTPEQCCVNLMEECDNIDRLLIVFIGKDGCVHYKSNFVDMTTKIGMLDIVKEMILRRNVHFVDGEERS